MRSDRLFRSSRRSRLYHVSKWGLIGLPPESARAPLTQVILYPSLDRFTKQNPWFPHRAGKHADIYELFVCSLGTISTPQGHDQSDNVAAPFKPSVSHRCRNDMRQERIGCYHDVGAGNQLRDQQARPSQKKLAQVCSLPVVQRREPWQRRARVPVERRRNPPHSPAPAPQLLLLGGSVFLQAIGWIGNHRVYTVVRTGGKPSRR